MHKITFAYPVDGSAPPKETVLEVDVPRYDQLKHRRIVFDRSTGDKMIELLGPDGRSGYGTRRFHIVDEDVLYVECGIVSMGGECVIEFLRMVQLPLGQQ